MMKPLLKVHSLSTHFFTEEGVVRAVERVSFEIRTGEILSLVGESGCGKSVTGLSILKLIPTPPGRIVSGEILFDGRNLLQLEEKEMERVRGNDISMISGGQRQRIGIARAVSLRPDLIVADEPVSALDVSIQAQILNLLMDLRDQLGLTYLFISHDLRIVKHISDRIAVMYMGKIVEMAFGEDLFRRPLHPYTQLLLKAIPKLDPAQRSEEAFAKEEPRILPSQKGCLFQPSCPHSKEKCQSDEPLLFDEGEGHLVACHFVS
jgi:oligopeptide/dipeptide ABC transporter ATP-binding protein